MNHYSRGKKILELLKSSAKYSTVLTESSNTQSNDVLNEQYIIRDALSFDEEDESDVDKYYDKLVVVEMKSDLHQIPSFLACTHGSGIFELQVLEMSNPRSELSNGECCGGGVRSPVTNRCSVPCQTFFRLCLKEYQSNVTSNGLCSFGNTSSHVIGRDSFTLADPDRGKLVLPFTFRWTFIRFAKVEKSTHKKNVQYK
ncbi:unnamed protein product [Diabrotica balteata]|uniref:Notch ligand N-terminal domain-containing protein n=1 Tax=Diabrotica balteata TaxID=107213 RepID=A0A9N9SP64_DIABA|nr:unnamed protein product [Diabrotica balteata]